MADTEGFIEVRMLSVPVALHARAASHMDALQREFDLIRRSEPEGNSVPHRLLTLIDELEEQFGGVGDRPREELARALERKDVEVDLVYRVPNTAGEAARRLNELLDEADAHCRAGDHLLTLATPSDALAYRRWFLAELIEQLIGAEPVPWPRWTQQAQADTATPPAGAPTAPAPLPEGWRLSVSEGVAELMTQDDMDIHSAPSLRQALQQLRDVKADRVVIDASRVTFLDSVGISVLVSAHRRLIEEDIPYELVPSARVLRALEIAGLDRILHLGGLPFERS